MRAAVIIVVVAIATGVVASMSTTTTAGARAACPLAESVAWTVVGDEWAHAFHVRDGLWATVLHGVEQGDGDVALRSGNREVACSVVAQDRTADVAVLWCPATTECARLELDTAVPGAFVTMRTSHMASFEGVDLAGTGVGGLDLVASIQGCTLRHEVYKSTTAPARGQSGAPITLGNAVVGMWAARSRSGESFGVAIPSQAIEVLLGPLKPLAPDELTELALDFDVQTHQLYQCARLETPALSESDERACFTRAVSGGIASTPGCTVDESMVERGQRLQTLVDTIYTGLAGPEALLILADSLFEACIGTSCNAVIDGGRLSSLRRDLRAQSFYPVELFGFQRVVSVYQSKVTKELLLSGAVAIVTFVERDSEQEDDIYDAIARVSWALPSPTWDWRALDPTNRGDMETLQTIMVAAILDQPVSASPDWLLCGMAAGAAQLGWGHAGSSSLAWKQCIAADEATLSWRRIVDRAADILTAADAAADADDADTGCYDTARNDVLEITWMNMMADQKFQIALYVALDEHNVFDLRETYQWTGRELAALRGAQLGLDGLARFVGTLQSAPNAELARDPVIARSLEQLAALLPPAFVGHGITEAGFAQHHICNAAGRWRTHTQFVDAMNPLKTRVCALHAELRDDVEDDGFDPPAVPGFCKGRRAR